MQLCISVQFFSEFQQTNIQRKLKDTNSNRQEILEYGQVFEPTYMYKMIPLFKECCHEDAEEFICVLFNAIQEEMIEVSLEYLLLRGYYVYILLSPFI